ncbi:MAG: ABC transporter ATP-binding protein [Candidatus Portnoybacteria bacterium]
MLIKIEDLNKDYVSEELVTPALRGVSFSVEEGELLSITGSSGSGKSTLMHIIGFLDKISSGRYFFDGEDTSQFDDDKLAEIRNQKVGFVFQFYNLLPRTSVLDNVLLPTIYLPAIDKRKMEEKARQLLERVGLSHRISHRPNQLSGGEQQRVAIVRALINSPRLVLADEPTGNLDSKSGEEVIGILQDLNKEGNTIVMVTHEKEVAECAQRVLILRDGVLVSDEKNLKQRIARDGLVK